LINTLLDTISAIKSFITFNNLPSESRKIVFYAEDSQSQNFLLDLVKEILLKFNYKVSYLTSDPNDSIFIEAKKNPNLHVFYIGTGIVRTIAFLNLKADLCIMTMPDLESFHLKKSKVFSVHYLYIFHALLSTHSIYRYGAFDSYDTIFCTGNQQMVEIRETEKKYNLPKKNLYKDGYRPLEFLINENKFHQKKANTGLKILIAPTWGENNIFNFCMNELIENLVTAEHQVYLRPHPMTIRDDYKKIDDIKKIFSNKENFFLQENHTNRDILFESDILITDWSGIGIEYGLGLLKPVIYIDIPKKNLNHESNKINITPIESKIRNEIGALVKIDDIHKIDKIIKEVIVKQKKVDLERLREQYVFIKDDGLEKSAKRVVSIANACRSRNYNNNNIL
jgi:YidC/Oxa1 family membrane protein insertase